LSHEERYALAQTLCDRYADATSAVVVGGVYGSTAHATDTPWSDLELLFVVRDGSAAQGFQALYNGTALQATVYEQGELIRSLQHPTPAWPFQMAIIEDLTVLRGDVSLPGMWLEMGRAVSRDTHIHALERALPGLVFESCGRIFSCRDRRNTHDLHVSAVETLLEMVCALCLLNADWVHHDYYEGIVDSFRFARLPRGYRDLAPALWETRDLDEAATLAGRLVESFVALLRSEGVALTDWAALTPHEWPVAPGDGA
jgi:kanamycin nucleotidyltransferase